MLEGYRNYKEQKGDFTELTAAWSKTLYEAEGLFLFGGSYQNQHTQAINKMVEYGLNSICSLYQIQLPADMLEALDELLLQERKLNLVIIRDITTGFALELRKGILEGRKAECVLKELCGRWAFSYRIIPRLQLADTVVFVEKNDTGVAKRMIRLFRDSLPKNSDVEVIS